MVVFFALWIEANGIEHFEVGCIFRFNIINDWMMKWGVKVVIVTGRWRILAFSSSSLKESQFCLDVYIVLNLT